MDRRTPLLSALLLALALSACAAPGPAETTPAPPPEAPADTTPAPAELVWTDQDFSQDFTAEDGTVVMSVDYLFPDIQNYDQDPAWSAIHDYYATEGAAYLENAQELAVYASGDYQVSKTLGEEFLPYGEAHSYRVAYQTDTLASLVRSYYANSVTGAAHPANYQFSETFDLTTGERLALDDCFTDAGAARSRILDTLAEAGQGAGFTREALEEQFNDAYFYLTEDHFVFYYQPDTLAPYAAGLLDRPEPASAKELVSVFSWDKIPKADLLCPEGLRMEN